MPGSAADDYSIRPREGAERRQWEDMCEEIDALRAFKARMFDRLHLDEQVRAW